MENLSYDTREKSIMTHAQRLLAPSHGHMERLSSLRSLSEIYNIRYFIAQKMTDTFEASFYRVDDHNIGDVFGY